MEYPQKKDVYVESHSSQPQTLAIGRHCNKAKIYTNVELDSNEDFFELSIQRYDVIKTEFVLATKRASGGKNGT